MLDDDDDDIFFFNKIILLLLLLNLSRYKLLINYFTISFRKWGYHLLKTNIDGIICNE